MPTEQTFGQRHGDWWVASAAWRVGTLFDGALTLRSSARLVCPTCQRLRVFVAFVFMFFSRGSRILAPLFLKEATNALTAAELAFFPWFAIVMYCGAYCCRSVECVEGVAAL